MFMAYLPPPDLRRLTSPKGKVAELRQELNSGGKKDKNNSNKKIALKKIVANMTMSNNDMVALFPDIIGCMHIQSLEIKKMYVHHNKKEKERSIQSIGPPCNIGADRRRCFLFLVNYARMRPEIAVQAIPVLERVGNPARCESKWMTG